MTTRERSRQRSDKINEMPLKDHTGNGNIKDVKHKRKKKIGIRNTLG